MTLYWIFDSNCSVGGIKAVWILLNATGLNYPPLELIRLLTYVGYSAEFLFNGDFWDF